MTSIFIYFIIAGKVWKSPVASGRGFKNQIQSKGCHPQCVIPPLSTHVISVVIELILSSYYYDDHLLWYNIEGNRPPCKLPLSLSIPPAEKKQTRFYFLLLSVCSISSPSATVGGRDEQRRDSWIDIVKKKTGMTWHVFISWMEKSASDRFGNLAGLYGCRQSNWRWIKVNTSVLLTAPLHIVKCLFFNFLSWLYGRACLI